MPKKKRSRRDSAETTIRRWDAAAADPDVSAICELLASGFPIPTPLRCIAAQKVKLVRRALTLRQLPYCIVLVADGTAELRAIPKPLTPPHMVRLVMNSKRAPDDKIPAPKKSSKGQEPCSNAISFYDTDEWKRLRYAALVAHGGRCLCCGRSAYDGVKIHVDHIKPISRYPELKLEISNLQPLCEDCNLGKKAWDMTDWRRKPALT